jgi:hypothetical protein
VRANLSNVDARDFGPFRLLCDWLFRHSQ